MKCRICGANLRKDGDICSNCYKKYKEDEEIKKDVKEIFKIKRKYSILYNILKNAWIILVFILASTICISSGGIIEELLLIVIFLVVLGILLFLDKRLAMATKVVFYDKKIVYTFKFLFIDKEKVIKYSDLKDIVFYQTFTQKRFGYGDLCFYATGSFPGAILLNGFKIKNVEDVRDVLATSAEIMASKQRVNK